MKINIIEEFILCPKQECTLKNSFGTQLVKRGHTRK